MKLDVKWRFHAHTEIEPEVKERLYDLLTISLDTKRSLSKYT
jgi:hypothetical protein